MLVASALGSFLLRATEVLAQSPGAAPGACCLRDIGGLFRDAALSKWRVIAPAMSVAAVAALVLRGGCQ
jgi:hypothetical protein